MDNFAEVKKLVDDLGKSVHDMRQNNEAKMAELAKNNGVAELKEAQAKLDEQVANMVKGLTDLQRANALGADNQKSNDDVAPEIKAAFSHLVRRGEGGLDAKSLSSLTNPDGGYLVPRDTSGRIIKKAQDYSPMRRYASVQSISGDALEGLNDNGIISTGWVGETAARTATATTQLGMWKVPAHEIYANPQATQRMLDDAEINVESWISGKLSEAFGQAEADAFINGNGVGKPRGILSRTFATTTDASRA